MIHTTDKIFREITRQPKDYEPIKFEFFQSEMEDNMYRLNEAIEMLKFVSNNSKEIDGIIYDLYFIKGNIQHKIDEHIKRGEWK